MIDKIKILGVSISRVDNRQVLEEVKKWLVENDRKHYIVTPNSEILVAVQKNEYLIKILNQADLALPDGIGLLWASRILGRPLIERVAGADFMEKLCELSAKKGFKVGLIGGKPGVAIKASECLKEKYPKLQVVLMETGNPDDSTVRLIKEKILRYEDITRSEIASSTKSKKILSNKKQKSPNFLISQPALPAGRYPNIDILFVAFGAPKQEIWISRNLDKLPVRIAIGVGGAFDFLAGVVPRAPKWVQNSGFEWLYRLLHQPWRIGRQMALLKFALLVFKERLSS